MQFEIDFLPVGNGERSGDAIALRYGENGAYTIQVVDGGDLEAGEAMVGHINAYYGQPSHISFVVVTHGDDDHTSGVRRVLENFEVGALIMNRPWLYAAEIIHHFNDARWTVDGLTRRLRDDFPILTELEGLAEEHGVPIYEAFQGTTYGAFTILAPTRERYLQLIPHFSRTPAARNAPPSGLGGLLARTLEQAQGAMEWIGETWLGETLEEGVETSASNESSVVQFADLGGKKILLTADAGLVSLREAADYMAALGYQLPGLDFVQIPHHGSRHNVSPSILDRWIGPKLNFIGQKRNAYAYASVGKECTTHPRLKVRNAFIRRGFDIAATKGMGKYYFNNLPLRPGWEPVSPMEFSARVER